MRKAKIAGAAIAAPLLVLGLSVAAAPNGSAMGASHMDHMTAGEHMPPTQTQGSVSYVSGGIGEDEAAAMKQAAGSYPLEMEFLRRAQPKDEYVADVKVEIKDQHDKKVLDTTANGPFLLAKLPAGRYTVTADLGDKAEKRTVQIAPHAHHRIVFEWGRA